MNNAIFFDRDGVLNQDTHLPTRIEDIRILEDTYRAFEIISSSFLKDWKRIVVSNQTVISRGLATEKEIHALNQYIAREIFDRTRCAIDKFYICPHHPEATLGAYRKNCDCRKPKPGMLLRAAEEFTIDLNASWMIGDRISDIIAGREAGCSTILIKTGMHSEKPIVSDAMDTTIEPDHICDDLLEAIELIIKKTTTTDNNGVNNALAK